jgi:hypothetical protein
MTSGFLQLKTTIEKSVGTTKLLRIVLENTQGVSKMRVLILTRSRACC